MILHLILCPRQNIPAQFLGFPETCISCPFLTALVQKKMCRSHHRPKPRSTNLSHASVALCATRSSDCHLAAYHHIVREHKTIITSGNLVHGKFIFDDSWGVDAVDEVTFLRSGDEKLYLARQYFVELRCLLRSTLGYGGRWRPRSVKWSDTLPSHAKL